MPKNPAAEEHVRAARAKAAYQRSYFAHALYALIPIQSEQCPTMAVDKWGRCYYNPEFVLACSVDEIATVWLHEIGHKLRHHHDRAHGLGITEATQKVANIAMDMELNDDIADEVAKLKDITALPPGAVYPSTYGLEDNQVWEVYYAKIMDEIEKYLDQLKDDGGGGSEDGGEEGNGGADGGGGGSSKQKGKGKQKPGKGNGGARGRKHKCGSGAHGVQQPWEDASPTNGGGEGIEDADWKDIERRVAASIREQHEKSRGTVPGTWVSWADDILRVERIPWDQELAGAVRWAVNDVAGKVIHNYKRPSRRQQATKNVVFPSMRRPIPNVAFVGDTSGSMSEGALALVRGVVEDVCTALGAALSFIATDAAAHGVQRAHNGRTIEMRGRGGTNMCVGITSALEDVQPRPDVIIVGSDCETPWPAEEPGARVIICAIEANDAAVEACPDWARVIVVRPEGED